MADLLSLTNELLLHIFQFLAPGKETQSLPVVCRRFLECVETPHLWRLLWLRWIASDAGLLEQAKQEAIKRAAKEKDAADPMDQETPSTDSAEAAPATTGVVDASDFALPPAAEGEITKKPVQRLICTDAMAYKADMWKHYAKAEAKFNAKVLEDSGVEGREKAAEKFKTVKWNLALNTVARGYDQMLKSIARAGMMPEGGFNNPFLGATALRVAASRGHVHVIRYLLSQHSKLDVNAVDAKLTSAIYYAAKNGHVAAIRKLASEGADVNTGIQPGHSGGCGGCACGLNLARFFGPNPRTKAKGSSPLWIAASREQPEAIRALVELGADVDKQASDGTSPFYIACKWNRLDAVKALLDPANAKLPDVNAPAGPEEYGASPLYVACDAGSEDVIEHLLANADRIRLNVDAGNQNGATPLYISCQAGRVSQVEKLIAAGANLEARRKSGATPLLIAASYGQSEVVERLLAAGAQVNIVASDGSTPLSCAAAEGHQSVVARLLAAGVDVNGST